MPVFTDKFKITVGVGIAIIVAGGLAANQYFLQGRVSTLEHTPSVIKEVITASPSATLVPATPTPKLIVRPTVKITGVIK